MASFSRLHPAIEPWARWLYAVAQDAGLRPVLTSSYRSVADQRRLYARRHSNPYPVAPPGASPHHTGLAFDLSLALPADQREEGLRALGELWESVGGRWGGRFKHYDPVHFDAVDFPPPYDWMG